MTGPVFLDTNVAIYIYDPRDPAKRERARAWIRLLLVSRRLIVSPQVLNEMFFVGIRKFPSIPRADLRSFVQDLLPACRAPLDAGVVSTALEIEELHAFHWWDCVIVASALAAGADYLLSEDMQHERTIGGMTIINPFLTEPSDVLSASH